MPGADWGTLFEGHGCIVDVSGDDGTPRAEMPPWVSQPWVEGRYLTGGGKRSA